MADSLLTEIDDAVRADKIAALWVQYRRSLLLVVAAILLGTTGSTLWQHYREKRGGERMLQFSESQKQFDSGKFAEAATGFGAIANEASGDQRTLAQLWQGRALAHADKKEEAITVLTAAAAQNGLWADLACLRLAALNEKEAACLADKKSSPLDWQRIQWHAATAWSRGHIDQAIATLEQLGTNKSAPEDVRSQATQFLTLLKSSKGAK